MDDIFIMTMAELLKYAGTDGDFFNRRDVGSNPAGGHIFYVFSRAEEKLDVSSNMASH